MKITNLLLIRIVSTAIFFYWLNVKHVSSFLDAVSVFMGATVGAIVAEVIIGFFFKDPKDIF